MAPQLKENFLADYPDLDKFDLTGLNPDFEETMFDLAKQVPEYGFWQDTFVDATGHAENLITPATRRAIDQVSRLFLFKEDGKLEAYSDKGVRNHLAQFIVAVRARLAQMAGNFRWLDNMGYRWRRENKGIDENRGKVLAGEKKLYYPHLTHRPIQSCTTEEFEASPNNHAKKVQRIMTNETDRLIILDEKEAYSPQTIGSLIVDPLRLTDRQLENLGFTLPWAAKKRVPRLEKIEFISSQSGKIKEALAALSPIGQGDPHDRFGRYRLFTSLDGEVIGTTTAPGRCTISKASLLDAIRSREHTRTSSLSETGKIAGVIRMILDVDRVLQKGKWEQVKDTEQLAEAKTTLFKAVEALKSVRNPDKKEAKELLEKAMTLESTFTRVIRKKGQPPQTLVTVRLNPGAKRTQLEKALRRLQTRKSHSMPRISRYIANDRQILEAELADHKAIPFAELEAYLNRHYKGYGPDDHKHLSIAQMEGMVSRLNEWYEKFSPPQGRKVYLEPYRSFCSLIMDELAKTVVAVAGKGNTVSDVKDCLEELKFSLRLKKFWDSWENLYDQHLTQEKLPVFTQLIKDLVPLRDQIADISETSPQDFILDAYREKINEMLGLCEDALAHWHDPDGKKKAKVIHHELKRKMREVNIVALLKSASAAATEEEAISELFGPPAEDDDQEE